ncbi:HNH endonuclease [Fibrella forsythiae]|uniref:HNH endonuclease n=1 Tax=Fibrella forsythiae TaxID=2817061 RepID=A0ABS3JBY2_9BACT|nr:HNH endonuclease [Fibrella forsythiae]MBO0947499.1 HNH endonuclease [Fibrella forsythiae]
MISVKKDFSNPPSGLLKKGCLDNIKLTISEKNKHSFSTHFYRDQSHATLTTLYNSKCAYCESPESPTCVLRVDHYRPKDGIKNTSHLGYYWLGYEWSNLILSCEKCNRTKSNNFPLANESLRVLSPVVKQNLLPNKASRRADFPLLKAEDPLLLNPELDIVEDHLYFKRDGTIHHLTIHGEASIKCYDLKRTLLVVERKKLVDKVLREIKEHLIDFFDGKINQQTLNYSLYRVYTQMLYRVDSKSKYSRMAYFVYTHFDKFIVSQLPSQIHQRIILTTFELFRQKKLI